MKRGLPVFVLIHWSSVSAWMRCCQNDDNSWAKRLNPPMYYLFYKMNFKNDE